MYKHFLLIVLSSFILACTGTKKATTGRPVGLVPMEHYVLKSDVNAPESVNYMWIQNQTDFEKIFEVFNPDNHLVIKPDFSGQQVVAVSGQASTEKVNYKFERAEIAGKNMNVYFTAKALENTTSRIPVALATVPKSIDVQAMNFYKNGELVKTVGK